MVGIGTALVAACAVGPDPAPSAARLRHGSMVPSRVRAGGVRGDPRARGRLDRHRGRAPAVGRLRLPADRRRGDPRIGSQGHLRRRPRPLLGARHRAAGRAARAQAPLGDPGRECRRRPRVRRRGTRRDVPYGPTRRSGRGPAMTAVQATAIVLLAGVTAYAVFGGADFGAGFWDLAAGRATTRAQAAGAHRRRHRPGLGGEPHVAHLRPRRPVDRLPSGLRGDHDRAVRAALSRRSRHGPAGRGVRVPPGRDGAARPAGRRRGVRDLVGPDPVPARDRGGCHREWPGPGRCGPGCHRRSVDRPG